MSFEKGDTVARRSVPSEKGVIVEGPKALRGETWYGVKFGGSAENILEEDLKLVEGGEETILDLFLQGAYGDERSFSRLLTLARINVPLRDTIYSYQASRTELHAHQYRPLLKYLGSPLRRILIADEVGLGKTIEAAYIFQEERARHDIQCVLVVCPASLRVKWRNELYYRFGESFELLDAVALRRRLVPEAERAPTGRRLFGIVSYETIRSQRTKDFLESSVPNIDLLIADEIHHCRNRETSTFKAMRDLVDNSDSVVFLSATPVHTGNDNLFNLMNLLLPERFDLEAAFQKQLSANRHVVRAQSWLCKGTAEGIQNARRELKRLPSGKAGRGIARDPFYKVVISNLELPDIAGNVPLLVETQEKLSMLNLLGDVITRTRKRDVHEVAPTRVAYSHKPVLSRYEQVVYDTLSSFIFKRFEEQYGRSVARFVLSGLQKQIASSLCAAVRHYQERFGDNDESDDITTLDIEEEGFQRDAGDKDGQGEYSLGTDQQFRDIIRSISTSRLYKEDSKFEALDQILSMSGKVIIFAYYKKSLRYLEDRLREKGVATVRIDGDVPTSPESPEEDERVRRIQQFKNSPECKVMLSSQVGSEGLDFQFCDCIVNWDLPWNPMVVEQRIGRIDRLGQESERIFIHNLVNSGTIEELILDRLHRRIGIFEDSIGELAPILGPAIAELTERLLSPKLTLEEKRDEVARSERVLVRKRADLRDLEENSDQLIGHDEMIRQKIDRIRHLGRFLTGKEVEVFVDEFLSRQFPASQLCDSAGGKGLPGDGHPKWLQNSVGLRQLITLRIERTDDDGQRLLQLMRGEKLKVAFDAETAREHPDAELIHSHHPLVRLIVEFYEGQPREIHRVGAIRLATDTITPGTYFYGWASIDERGVFHSRQLVMRLFRIPEEGPVEDPEVCERILHEMVVDGQSWEGPPPSFPGDTLEGLYVRLEENVADYAKQYRERRNAESEALVRRQMQSIQASHQVKIGRRHKAIETARSAGRGERIILMHQAQIGNLERDLDLKRKQIEDNRTVDVGYRIEGVGWLQVVDE